LKRRRVEWRQVHTQVAELCRRGCTVVVEEKESRMNLYRLFRKIPYQYHRRQKRRMEGHFHPIPRDRTNEPASLRLPHTRSSWTTKGRLRVVCSMWWLVRVRKYPSKQFRVALDRESKSLAQFRFPIAQETK
jgi:hypothetical protein